MRVKEGEKVVLFIIELLGNLIKILCCVFWVRRKIDEFEIYFKNIGMVLKSFYVNIFYGYSELGYLDCRVKEMGRER